GEVVGFYEKNDTLAENYAKSFNIPRFQTPEELLASEAEGVIVCSASSDHAEDMIKIARAGKHIFTEKVLALTDADCDRIERAVNESGVKFVISLFQKYLAPRIAVKQVAASGELGKLNYLRFRNCHSGSTRDWLPKHFYDAKECGGGAMIDLGAHGMYLTEWILGMPSKACSQFTVSCELEAIKQKNTDGVEDNAVTVMSFENGAIAVNETGFVSNYSPVTLEVFGEDGYVRMVGDRVVKCTKATDGAEVEVALGEAQPSPLVQFLTGNILDGCGMKEAKALTHMMTMAYAQ
ncbi:MAG: Gfo/Idh/MocA family oxidoreductase, partial [Clostridia bacterium]|nr:Gfo/Idh/MocA family oxidoreductase [Clostridia bacterium]